MPSPRSLRVNIQQPSLAKYRVPVFAELARREGIKLNLHYGNRKGIPNVDPIGFEGSETPLHRKKLIGLPIYWHSPQLKLATRKHSDILVLTWNIQYLSLIPALARAKMNGVKTILWGHGYSKNEGAFRSKLRRTVGNLADALLFYNQTTADEFVKLGFNANKIFAAPNSLDQTEIQKNRDDWLASPDRLERFKKTNRVSGPTILFVSRLHRDNRLDLVVQALAQLRSEFPSVELVVVGKGEEEKVRLQKLADDLDVPGRIRFLGAIYEESELAGWFLSSDVFCYPANIGLSVLHAFGYGLPVVASDSRETQNPEVEAVIHHETGLMFQHQSVEDLTEKLGQIFRSAELKEKLGAGGRRAIEEKYNIKTMVDGFENAIKYCARRLK